ncbi:MAG: nucleotide disphospho-sugar-binding domain-containing protein [Planctomycetota bacterium]
MSKRFGFISFSSEGHLNPTMALAKELEQRGHVAVVYSLPDGVPKIERHGLRAQIYGETEFTIQEIEAGYRELGRLKGLSAVRHTLDGMKRRARVGLRELPVLVERDGIDGLIVDQVVPDGAAIARAMHVPYVTVCNALPFNLSSDVPPVFSHGQAGNSVWKQLRNRSLNALATRMAGALIGIINDFQRQRGLPLYKRPEQFGSELAEITQIPRQFDFSNRKLPEVFHYTGPFHDLRHRAAVDFPWDRIHGDQPLIYASMGTLQNQIRSVFHTIAAACADMPVQLVISLGGQSEPTELGVLPGDPIVVRYAPQLELLARSTACITHAGLNTTLECLACGIPMLTIPVTNDQPGVAARVTACQAGLSVKLGRLEKDSLRVKLQRLLDQPQYSHKAAAMAKHIAEARGLATAATIIEEAFASKVPIRAPFHPRSNSGVS